MMSLQLRRFSSTNLGFEERYVAVSRRTSPRFATRAFAAASPAKRADGDILGRALNVRHKVVHHNGGARVDRRWGRCKRKYARVEGGAIGLLPRPERFVLASAIEAGVVDLRAQ